MFTRVYRPACEENGLECYHVGVLPHPGSITRDIVQGILDADVIIADLSETNPNVFYELGITHALGNNTVTTARNGTALPFDVRAYRILLYDNTAAGRERLKELLSSAISSLTERLGEPNNPVQEVLAARPLHNITTILNTSLVKLADATRAKAREIGFHVWAPLRVAKERSPVLVRLARDNIRDVPPSPARSWHKGEGVVGQCWERDDRIALNLCSQPYRSVTAKRWKKKPVAFQMGQTYGDFRQTTKAFMAIFAVPIKRDDHFQGCLSVNIDRESRASFHGVWPSPLREIMYAAAKAISGLWHRS